MRSDLTAGDCVHGNHDGGLVNGSGRLGMGGVEGWRGCDGCLGASDCEVEFCWSSALKGCGASVAEGLVHVTLNLARFYEC